MSTVDYTRIAERAVALIERFGTTTQLVRMELQGPRHDPIAAAVEYTVKVAKTVSQEWDNDTGAFIRKTIYYMTADTSVVPRTADKLRFGGVLHTLSRVEDIAPAGDVVVYKLMGSTT